MGILVEVVGPSGVGKTTLVKTLSRRHQFALAYEEHAGRPFQSLFKMDKRCGLANQIDYLLLRAEQEKRMRASPRIGLMDGGLDLDFHGFTRLFHARGRLSDPEFDLCRRLYEFLRSVLPPPELIVHLTAREDIIRARLAARDRINIASAEDTTLFNQFLEEWLATLPVERLIRLNASDEGKRFKSSVSLILDHLKIPT